MSSTAASAAASEVSGGAAANLNSWLGPTERVLWSSQPGGTLLSEADAFLIPFTLLWMAFACFGVVSMASGRTPLAALTLVPFVLLGLYVTAGRFVIKYWTRRKTVYAVTNQRVIVLVGKSVRSLSLDHLPTLEWTSGARGRVVFGTRASFGILAANSGMEWLLRSASGELPVAFYDIPGPDVVVSLIGDAARRNGADTGG